MIIATLISLACSSYMRVLLTGANGYIGKRLLPVLLEEGHEVTCCVRDRRRFGYEVKPGDKIEFLEIDFLDPPELDEKELRFDCAYYLIHSMNASIEDFGTLESKSAENFIKIAELAGVKQVVYLSGITNEKHLSPHLVSRKTVEDLLRKGRFSTTILRAGIIIGSGSASFEIIRDLVEKLPVMVTPKWVLTRSQPIAIRNVIAFLYGVMGRAECYDKTYDIAGPDILTYKEMLLRFAKARGLKRRIITLPLMTPRLSSYWLFFVTSTSYKLAVNLVNSMKVEVIGNPNDLHEILNIRLLTYSEAVEQAFTKIEQRYILSSWKDAIAAGASDSNIMRHIEVPEHGCFKDRRESKIKTDVSETMDRLWSIGGRRGWYSLDWLWGIRGFIDQLFGGSGLRRGRTHPERISPGDALDFWRVLVADRAEGRLLLYAEMKLPGEAWLEWEIKNRGENENYLHQTATFRPRGIWGRLYWYSVAPFHLFVFRGMLNKLTR